DLHRLAEPDAAMHRQLEIEAGSPRPSAAVVDVTGKALLAAVKIDGGDALAGLQKGNRNMQRGGGLAGPAFLVAQHDHVRRARLPLASLQQHVLTPRISSSCARLRSSKMRARRIKIAATLS